MSKASLSPPCLPLLPSSCMSYLLVIDPPSSCINYFLHDKLCFLHRWPEPFLRLNTCSTAKLRTPAPSLSWMGMISYPPDIIPFTSKTDHKPNYVQDRTCVDVSQMWSFQNNSGTFFILLSSQFLYLIITKSCGFPLKMWFWWIESFLPYFCTFLKYWLLRTLLFASILAAY